MDSPTWHTCMVCFSFRCPLREDSALKHVIAQVAPAESASSSLPVTRSLERPQGGHRLTCGPFAGQGAAIAPRRPVAAPPSRPARKRVLLLIQRATGGDRDEPTPTCQLSQFCNIRQPRTYYTQRKQTKREAIPEAE